MGAELISLEKSTLRVNRRNRYGGNYWDSFDWFIPRICYLRTMIKDKPNLSKCSTTGQYGHTFFQLCTFFSSTGARLPYWSTVFKFWTLWSSACACLTYCLPLLHPFLPPLMLVQRTDVQPSNCSPFFSCFSLIVKCVLPSVYPFLSLLFVRTCCGFSESNLQEISADTLLNCITSGTRVDSALLCEILHDCIEAARYNLDIALILLEVAAECFPWRRYDAKQLFIKI